MREHNFHRDIRRDGFRPKRIQFKYTLVFFVRTVGVPCCCCCFSHSAYWLPTRKKLLYTVANPARGLLNREKRTKEKVWQHASPPTPRTAKITRRDYRRYAGLGRSRVRTRIPSACQLGQWVWLRKNSTLPSAIKRFPVSLLISSPGDV